MGFQHDVAYGEFKCLPRRTASDQILCNKAFNSTKIQNIMDNLVDLFQWLTNFSIKSLLVVLLHMKLAALQEAEELHKPTIKKFAKRKILYSFKENTWGAFRANM